MSSPKMVETRAQTLARLRAGLLDAVKTLLH